MVDFQAPGMEVVVRSANSKRQRRPSVRLNEIGDPTSDSSLRKTKQWQVTDDNRQWKGLQKDLVKPQFVVRSNVLPEWGLSKTRLIGNLTRNESQNSDINKNPDNTIKKNKDYGMDDNRASYLKRARKQRNHNIKPEDNNLQSVDYCGTRINSNTGSIARTKSRTLSKKTKHVKGRRDKIRAGIVGNFAEGFEGQDGFKGHFSNACYEIETAEGFRDFDMETSHSPVEMNECTHFLDDSQMVDRDFKMGTSGYPALEAFKIKSGGLFSERRDHAKYGETGVGTGSDKEPGLCMECTDGNWLDLPSDAETKSKQDANEVLDRGWDRPGLESSVTLWLDGLGLGSYSQLFQIHEVDMEVLPLLTFEDLRDMGIHAVGSRRKMYNAIQKLQESFAG